MYPISALIFLIFLSSTHQTSADGDSPRKSRPRQTTDISPESSVSPSSRTRNQDSTSNSVFLRKTILVNVMDSLHAAEAQKIRTGNKDLRNVFDDAAPGQTNLDLSDWGSKTEKTEDQTEGQTENSGESQSDSTQLDVLSGGYQSVLTWESIEFPDGDDIASAAQLWLGTPPGLEEDNRRQSPSPTLRKTPIPRPRLIKPDAFPGNLQTLNLSNANITDNKALELIIAFKDRPNLKTTLTELDLSNNSICAKWIRDELLRTVSQFKNLRKLNLDKLCLVPGEENARDNGFPVSVIRDTDDNLADGADGVTHDILPEVLRSIPRSHWLSHQQIGEMDVNVIRDLSTLSNLRELHIEFSTVQDLENFAQILLPELSNLEIFGVGLYQRNGVREGLREKISEKDWKKFVEALVKFSKRKNSAKGMRELVLRRIIFTVAFSQGWIAGGLEKITSLKKIGLHDLDPDNERHPSSLPTPPPGLPNWIQTPQPYNMADCQTAGKLFFESLSRMENVKELSISANNTEASMSGKRTRRGTSIHNKINRTGARFFGGFSWWLDMPYFPHILRLNLSDTVSPIFEHSRSLPNPWTFFRKDSDQREDSEYLLDRHKVADKMKMKSLKTLDLRGFDFTEDLRNSIRRILQGSGLWCLEQILLPSQKRDGAANGGDREVLEFSLEIEELLRERKQLRSSIVQCPGDEE